MKTPSRIVVTGLGVISAVGCNPTDFWQSLLEGRSGARDWQDLQERRIP